MSPGRAVDAVVFDYGGVLTGPVRESLSAWVRAGDIEPASLTRVLRAWLSRDAPDGSPIHRLETGELPAAGFEQRLAAALDTRRRPAGGAGGAAGPAVRRAPSRAGHVRAGRGAARARVRVALLSNSWGNTYPRDRIDGLFDPVVISAEVGLRKPLPAIYRRVLDGLGVPAARIVLVDDAEPNVEGARAVGMRAVLHTAPATTRAALAELIPELTEIPSTSTGVTS